MRFIFFILLLKTISVYSQSANNETDAELQIENIIEYIIENSEEDTEIDISEIRELLNYFYLHPVSLNSSNFEEFVQTGLLSSSEAVRIIDHRKRFGKILSVYELQAVEGLSIESARRIKPYVSVEIYDVFSEMSFFEPLIAGSHDIIIRYRQNPEKERAYLIRDTASSRENNTAYLGSPFQLYTRYNYRLGTNISYGITANKKPGEEFFSGSNPYGFDFYSAHLFIRNDHKRIKRIAIGDFQAGFGQGLVFWSGFGFNKSSEVMYSAKVPRGIQAYRSSDESLFLRGIATTWAISKQLEFTAFASQKKIDGNIDVIFDETKNLTQNIATSIIRTGLHRTHREIENKNTINESICGANLNFKTHRLNLGATFVNTELDPPLQKKQIPYNQFDLNGSQFWNLGMDYSFLFKNFYFFGEKAVNHQSALGMIHGVLASLNPALDLGFVYRSYPEKYSAYISNAFRDGVRNSNEKGQYLAISAKLSQQLKLNVYFDHFSNPWLRFRLDAPASGYDYLFNLNYKPNRQLETYLRIRLQQKAINVLTDENPQNLTVPYKKQNIRWHFRYDISKEVSLRSRIEVSGFRLKGNEFEQGMWMHQDVIYKKGAKITLLGRYGFFDVESFDTRIYTYENDILYSFSVPFFQGKGIRYYGMIKYRLKPNLDVWARIARTNYFDRKELGSGLALIEDNKRTEVKLQLRLKI